MTDDKIIMALALLEILVCETDAQRQTVCDALDLINRQKAEIERLKKEINLVSILYQDEQERNSIIKAEVIKETIQAVKSKSSSSVMTSNGIVIAGTRSYQISEVTLNEIEKEMVGESNG
jgi:predicted nucleic acid-binding protein